jgi:hypothetical protein
LSTLWPIKYGGHREEELPAIWQMGSGLVEPFAQRDEIVVQLAVVEGTQLD